MRERQTFPNNQCLLFTQTVGTFTMFKNNKLKPLKNLKK